MCYLILLSPLLGYGLEENPTSTLLAIGKLPFAHGKEYLAWVGSCVDKVG